MEYELLFFTSVANENRIGEIKKEIEEVLTSQGGNISVDFFDIGKRKFAHPIKRQTHGFYSFCRFELEQTENIPEINRRLALNEKLMRHIIVRSSEIGKPIAAPAISEEVENRPTKIDEKKIAQMKSSPKENAKVGMENLDEKLEELLDSPE